MHQSRIYYRNNQMCDREMINIWDRNVTRCTKQYYLHFYAKKNNFTYKSGSNMEAWGGKKVYGWSLIGLQPINFSVSAYMLYVNWIIIKTYIKNEYDKSKNRVV